MKFLLLILLMTWSNFSKADHSDAVHVAAHVGTAYTLTTLGAGVLKKATSLGPVNRFIVSGLATLALGVIYDAQQPRKGSSTIRNLAGVGLAVGSGLVLEF